MAQLKAGLITIAALLVLWAGAWLVLMQKQPTAIPSTTAESATATVTATSSSELPPPAALPVLVTTKETALQKGAVATNTAAAPKTAASIAPATATLVVNGTRYAIHSPAGSTLKVVFDALQTEGALTYKSKDYAGLGALVTEINGRASGAGYYWIFYVNGAQSQTGITSTRIRSGDVIEWKLEKSY